MPEDINQNRDDNGTDNNPQSGQIDWRAINPADIPFDVLKETEAFKNERKEATERRLKIKELEGQLNTQDKAQTEREVPSTTQTDDSQMTAMQQQFKQFQEFMQNTLKTNEATARRNAIAQKLAEKRVVFDSTEKRDAAIEFIDNGSTENLDERIDKFVSTTNLKVQDTNNTGSGNSDGEQDPYNPLLSEIDRKLGFEENKTDVFSPSFQRGIRGGAVVRN